MGQQDKFHFYITSCFISIIQTEMVTNNMDINYTTCSYVFFTVITIFLLQRLLTSSTRRGTPPGPRALPILGHMHLLRSSLPRSLQALSQTYGPLMNIRIGSLQVLVVSDSDTAKQILKTHDPDFASKFVFGPRHFNVYKGAEFFNAPYGPYWRFMKKLCMTKLFAGHQLDRFVDIREEETLALLRSLVEKSRNGEACDLGLEFTALTTKILSKMVMGKRCRQNSNLPIEIRKIVSDIMACATRLGLMELFGPLRDLDVFGNGEKLRSSIWRYDELVEKILKDYEDGKSGNDGEKDKDIVDILLDTECNRDMKINGYDVKSGTKIFINAYGIMRDPRTYKDPDKFVPERFLVAEENTERKMGYYYQQYMLELKGQDVNYLAFGSGRRACLGASHASLVLSLTVGSLVQCFDWTVKGDEEKFKIKLPTGFSASGTAGGTLHKLSTHYGPLMYLFIGSIPNVIVSSTEMANEILKSNELNFLNRPTMQNVDYLTYGSADFFSAPYGLHWNSRAIDRFANVRTEELRKLLVRVMKKAEIEESVDLGEQLKELTSSIITRMMFRERRSDSGRREEVIKMVVELNELAGFFNVSETFWFLRRLDLQGIKKRLKNARERYDVIIERIMKEHESRNHKDAGDTSAITVEWALSELINNPEIMKKAQQEIEQVVGDKRLVQESDLCNLSYIQAVVKETLRLHPGGPIFVRESNEECAVAGYRIPAKTRVIVNVWAIGRDPNQWEDPLEFKPERFEGSEWKVMSEKMVSFGAGRRSCPGEKMVFRFVPLVLAAVIQCFELKVKGRVEMSEGSGSSLPRATPLVCVPVAREGIKSLFSLEPKVNF
ncbi:hypothetical protein HID58_045054 [Brassica napus]|uniref:Uncharacterized protein n=1 Tax=Brassica napus TaxID=3708 RepID=A0ABQ8ASH2_BRANA|nr:hypothetical protein HID58_045054 [Brassica napus]